jgi:hypothetical protein
MSVCKKTYDKRCTTPYNTSKTKQKNCSSEHEHFLYIKVDRPICTE